VNTTPDERINERILAKLAKTNYLEKVEAAHVRMPTQFSSPEMKRLHLRYFDSFQMNVHFISVIARTRLPEEVIEKLESNLTSQLDELLSDVNKDLVGSEKLYTDHAIATTAEYAAQPLAIDARVISGYGRRYLELMIKVDQLMPMIDTLSINGVISQRELTFRKSRYHKAVRSIAGAARNLAAGLRKRFFAAVEEGSATAGASAGSKSTAASGRAGNVAMPLSDTRGAEVALAGG
jgi:hypothetical protein